MSRVRTGIVPVATVLTASASAARPAVPTDLPGIGALAMPACPSVPADFPALPLKES